MPRSVHAQGPCVAGPHSGTISSDESWCLANSPHIIDNDVIVAEGVTLNIEPGVTVQLRYGAMRDVDLIVHGTLTAQGTPTDTIRFTSDQALPNKGDWSQIRFGDYSVDNVLDYVTVEYGGRCSTGGQCPTIIVNTDALAINHSTIRRSVGEGMQINSASPAIHNTTFEDNNEIALYLDGGACFPEMSNLTAAGNGYDAIGINGNTYIADYTWGDAGISEYRISDSIVVNAGVTLTVEPGTTVKIGWPKALVVHGTLQAQGTSTDIIRFTSASDTPGPGGWGSIQFKDTSTNSILEHVTVEYGGDGIGGQANVVANTSSLTIRHSTIARSENDGVRLDRGVPVIEYNSIVDNGGYGVNNLDDSITAYAQCNWWGHASGPTHSSNPDGLGQGVSDHVVFTPWMTASDDEECIVPRPPTGVEIFGPTEGLIKTAYTFTATVSPDETALLPITYTWEADRQDPVIHFRGALTDSASFTWAMANTFVITLTAGNPAGSHFATHTIEIGGGYSIYLPLVLRNS